jgi:MoaA/NifB/PqqE/SkfB family radical SAM enzyme/glycosyltransferase involved in cell wall biosynthesis
MSLSTCVLVRRGFPQPRLGRVDDMRVLPYTLGAPFGPVWSEARSMGAEFALLVDDATPVEGRVLRLLHRILASSPNVDGVTLGTDALRTVYAAPPAPDARVAFAARRISALPSWLALLRVAAWPEESAWRTPEFFLLSQTDRLRTFQTLAPSVNLDAIEWAGSLVPRTLNELATDYAAFEPKAAVPPQFRVTIPGSSRTMPPFAPAPGPTFSVLIPSIRPDFLREAVASVVAQTYPDWELRVGIDGPKENQRRLIVEVLREFVSDPRFHVRYFEHRGTGPTRRALAEQSRGRYITTVDDDDRLPPTTLERFARVIEESPGIPLMRGGTRIFGLLEDYLSPRIRYRVDGISNDLFEVTQPWVVRRDLLQALGGFEWDPQLKNAGEDSDLLLKADREGYPVHLIDEPLYERRLSTLNQTLDCSAEECLRHVHNLYAKHDPRGWSLADVHLAGASAMVDMRTVHVRDDRGATIVCSTRFMNFQQVGSREGVVIDLEVTSLCNAVCSFCPREHLDRSRRFIDLNKVRALADSLKNEATPTVVLCGIGEPTLHPELHEIIGLLADAGVNVCMTTNGWNLSPDAVDRLVASGLRELNVSLNAASPDVHASLMRLRNFHEITSACRDIAAGRERWPSLKFHVSFVLTEANQHEIEPFVEAWDRVGVSRIWLHPLTNRSGLLSSVCRPARAADLAERFADRPRVLVDLFPSGDGPANLCRIARGVDFISVEGDMLLCAQDYKARHRFGNLDHAPVAELHHNKILEHLRGATAETCSTCSFCPSSFRGGADATYTIVQAGAC